MDRGWYVRLSVIVAAVAVAWLALWPSVDPMLPAGARSPAWVKSAFPGRINPGLDMQGGLRLMYEVEIEEYLRDQADSQANELLQQLGTVVGVVEGEITEDLDGATLDRIREKVNVRRVGDQRIRVTLPEAADAEKIDRDWLRAHRLPDLRVAERSGTVVTLEVREEQLGTLQETAVQQAVRTIEDRIDNLGLREASVQPRGTDIVVEVPGADEAQFDQIRGIISRTARLEFKIVDDADDFVGRLDNLPEGITTAQETASLGEGGETGIVHYLVASGVNARQRLTDYIATQTPPQGRELLLGQLDPGEAAAADVEAGEESWRTYYLHSVAELTGDGIEDAFTTYDQQEMNRPVVSLEFKTRAAERFEELTGRNVRRRMAIVLDDRVFSAPVIQQRIGGGRAQITLGNGDHNRILREANDLVIVLKAGALPAPLRPANEQVIGPTLGRDSVEQGTKGAIVGVLLVLFFMALYYEVAGIVANVAVLLNVVLLLALMAVFQATLTLPGIAAIALTVGMAVDGNVLITERIREELRVGKSPRSAVDQGFDRAFSSIFDGQLTTFIAGIVLFQYGTGPIKGFAVMLMIGIATSLFTSVFCSRVMLDWIVRGLKVRRLRVG